MKGEIKMRKGFTLLELIIVIVILGILATLGFSQYTKMVERGRAAEARMVLGQMRTAAIAYHQEFTAWPTAISDMSVSAGGCDATHHFGYASAGTLGTATRCTAGQNGKSAGPAYSITLDYNLGSLTTGGY